MKEFHTVVLDRLTTIQGEYTSEPYEAGWAEEAIAFLRIHSKNKNGVLSFRVQISPDGIIWVDEGSQKDDIREEGLYFLRVKEFGGWLRLVIESDEEVKITTYFALKG